MKSYSRVKKTLFVRMLSKNPKLSRAEKQLQIRTTLLAAAAKVVGEEGYSAAMVSTITTRAGVSQGTFYNYFDSRQDLFDQLLPSLSSEMLDFIQAKSTKAASDTEAELLRFKAFFAFLVKKPEFYRILYESELFAPKAFQRHVDLIAKGYTRVLRRAVDTGDTESYDPRELEAIAFILMGAREYLSMKYARSKGRIVELPDWVARAYMKFVSRGLWTADIDREHRITP